MSKCNYMFLFVSVVVLFIDNVYAATEDERAAIIQGLKPFLQTCTQDHGLTVDTVKAAKEGGTLESLNSCFFACVLKKTGFITESGAFDPDKALEKSKKYIKGEDDLNKIAEIVKICTSVNDEKVSDGDNGCDRSKLLVKCFLEQKSNFPLLSA